MLKQNKKDKQDRHRWLLIGFLCLFGVCLVAQVRDNAQEHRLNRAFQLLERVAEFCDKRQLVTVNRSLLSIAVDAADISRAVSSLDKRPAPGQPFPNNTGTSGAGK